MGSSICYAYAAVAIGAVIYLLNRWYRRGFISDFTQKYVFITGTDSGFGHKLAVDLDRLGLHIYAGCYTKKGAENLKSKTSSNLKTISLDVTDQASVENAKAFIENDLPSGKDLWGIVNNAGILGNVDFNLATFEDYQQVMNVNYFGSIRVTEAFERLIKKSQGRFVQISSMTGRGSVGFAPYTCSKFAIGPYTDELRRYMKPFGVGVSLIEPGCVLDTGILDCEDCLGVLRSKFLTIPGWKKAELGINYLDKLIGNYYEWLSKPMVNYNSVNMVTDSMTHALGAEHPKSRYLVGYEARLFVLLTACAPDWFLDGFIQFALWLLRQKQVKSKF